MILQVGVKALIKNDKGQYLFLRRSERMQAETEPHWDIPGGRIDPTERLEQALLAGEQAVTGQTRQQRLHQPNIGIIASHDLRLADGLSGPRRHIQQTARTDSDYCYFSHSKATVTFSNFVLRRARRPPRSPAQQYAAASQTLPMPMVSVTKADSSS